MRYVQQTFVEHSYRSEGLGMTHEVMIAGAGPTGMMLAGELMLAGVDVAVVERRASALSRFSISAALRIDFWRAGVQDAVNLGWKLAQVVKGISPESLLDTYHAERHPIGARVLRNTMAAIVLRHEDELTQVGLADALTTWFGSPAAA
jgi:2-polyprenyl-6-methoxyphenol hydroxylase-like FAD-dependent oxidoreductase